MKRTHMLLGLVFPLASIAAEAPWPRRIDILSDGAHPFANVAAVQAQLGSAAIIRYFAIDAQPRIEESLSKDLPANPDQARTIALQRIQALDRAKLEKELSESVEGLLLARRYRITRYPAVVFDEGKSVVYGVTDLREAMRLYRRSVTRER